MGAPEDRPSTIAFGFRVPWRATMTPVLRLWSPWILAILMCLAGAPTPLGAATADSADAASEEAKDQINPATGKPFIPNKRCLKCHGDEEDQTVERDDGTVVNIFVHPEDLAASVHGQQHCQSCHANVTDTKHEDDPPQILVSCVECHQQTWGEHKEDKDPKYQRLGVVVQQIDSYMHSVHARPSRVDQSRTNATCYDCHDAHRIGTLGSEARADHRLRNPEVCGRCHEEQKEQYLESAHGRAVTEWQDPGAAVCSDCHTTHQIDSPKGDATQLLITQNCGSCHQEEQKTYLASYHGQVNRLGYAHTAKCFDCHGSHQVGGVDDPTSKIHKANRLETCQQCHEDAPEGFLGFHPHGNTRDFKRYPGLWLTAKFMQALIIGVFLFFWTHVILWFYREYRDRREGKSFTHVPPTEGTLYFRRFSWTWRVIHLLFALSTMVLVLSGTTLLFAHTGWAKAVIDLLGGPQAEAIVHRTAATIWLSVFGAHVLVVAFNLLRKGGRFQWLGPTSLVPNMQDLRDVGAMFRWFFGRAPRPSFDRWSYWQKFDYWAPFWGAAIIGFSGLTLFFPTKTAEFLPGWVFNVATIVHAEEALLATMFIFTVHFFNSHFRPDRFPMSTIMFTGAVPLEEFQFEHRKEFERLKASGELECYLVKPPSERFEKGSRALAAVLILAGLGLLTLVLIGYVTMPH
jgi:cytochrome b subunit of formate dehydrogenase